jgi:uncharacterized membrane protein YczE
MSDRTAREWSHPVFFIVALLWLPVGLVLSGLLRGFGFDAEPGMWPRMALSLIVVAPAGLPLALACRQLRRLGYVRATWIAAAVLAPATVAASLLAGLLGPLAIAVYAVILSLPVWIAVAILRRRR